jgi:hypothetical protein
VNPDDFRGPGFQTGYDPVWVDLLAKHAEQPFHLLVGGGDQLYCDGCVILLILCMSGSELYSSVVREPELQGWMKHQNSEEKRRYPLSEEMSSAIDRFYFVIEVPPHTPNKLPQDGESIHQTEMMVEVGK